MQSPVPWRFSLLAHYLYGATDINISKHLVFAGLSPAVLERVTGKPFPKRLFRPETSDAYAGGTNCDSF